MKWLHEIKPELVHFFHEREKVRSYAIDRIVRRDVPKIEFIITTYSDDLSDALLNDLASRTDVSISLGENKYVLASVRFERIDLKLLVESARPIKEFSVRFLRPVYFNTKRGNYPLRFPLPEILFGNLANIWNDLARGTAEIDRTDLTLWIGAHLYSNKFEVSTPRARIGKAHVRGTKGSIRYKVAKLDEHFYKHYFKDKQEPSSVERAREHYFNNSRWIDLLARLGQLTNAGENRTAGLGVMRYRPIQYH